MRAVAAGLAAAIALAVGCPGVAGAATQGWIQQPVPLPGGAVSGGLASVSCLSADFCLAGGGERSEGPAALLGEWWDGTSWQGFQFTRAQHERPNADLEQVLCVSTSNCFMVGEYHNSPAGTELPLAEHWDGSTWTVQALPGAGTVGGLAGISCPAADDCLAVGSTVAADGGHFVPLAEHWNGRRWARQHIPWVKGTGIRDANDSGLGSVSCASAASCTAVGSIGCCELESLAEHWNGDTWAIQPTPAPAKTPYSALASVSCPTPAFCVAVGFAEAIHAEVFTAMTEIWTGGSWVQQPLPLPANSVASHLTSVSCVSSARCTAVGVFTRARRIGGQVPTNLAEYWTGTSWAIQPTAKVQEPQGFYGISCTGPRVCTAVGIAHRGPLAEAENQ